MRTFREFYLSVIFLAFWSSETASQTCTVNQFSSGTACINCTAPCFTCVTSATFCTSCAYGNYQVGPNCYPCSTGCASCTGGTATTCTSCMSGYLLDTTTSTCTSQAQATQTSSSSGMSTLVIVLIAVGAFILLVILIVFLYFLVRNLRRQKTKVAPGTQLARQAAPSRGNMPGVHQEAHGQLDSFNDRSSAAMTHNVKDPHKVAKNQPSEELAMHPLNEPPKF